MKNKKLFLQIFTFLGWSGFDMFSVGQEMELKCLSCRLSLHSEFPFFF